MKSKIRIISGVIFLVVFVFTCVFLSSFEDWRQTVLQMTSIASLGAGITLVFPKGFFDKKDEEVQRTEEKNITRRTAFSLLIMLVLVPITMFIGMKFFGDRKYYFISILVILEMILPFCFMFDGRKPQAREIVLISVLCAIAIIGREAFFMLPQFKPLLAVVIISGVCFGGEAGFLVGAICSFVSNIYFGQGPWTLWQMFVSGMIGMLAGILFQKKALHKNRIMLSLYGGLSTLFIYGGIMNPASVLMWNEKPTMEMFISAYVMGFPFDLIHAASTMFFLWIAGLPMIEKLDRIKLKYGIKKLGGL